MKAMGGGMSFREALRERLEIIRPDINQIREFIRTKPPRLSPGIK
jgi:phosphoserine phosphatase